MMDLRDPQFDIITGSFDFARLCKVTEAYLLSMPVCDEKLAEHAKKTFAKCLKVNDDRVRIVHGTWLLGPGTTHLARNILKMTRHFENPQLVPTSSGLLPRSTSRPASRAEIWKDAGSAGEERNRIPDGRQVACGVPLLLAARLARQGEESDSGSATICCIRRSSRPN